MPQISTRRSTQETNREVISYRRFPRVASVAVGAVLSLLAGAQGISRKPRDRCPLLGVERTLLGHTLMSAFDPKRTFGPVQFADLPAIEGPAGRFMLQQMAAVADLEAGLISHAHA